MDRSIDASGPRLITRFIVRLCYSARAPLHSIPIERTKVMPHKTKLTTGLSVEVIERKIYLIRGLKVMIDVDLAELYGVSTKRLNQQVTRNKKRFPEDFMFRLTKDEAESLRLQFATSSSGHGGRHYLPHAFTEQGVAMLSSVLNSEQAIEVNIAIMRAFVRLRQMLETNEELNRSRRHQRTFHARQVLQNCV